jgi:chromosome segregation ATPase
MRRKQNCEGLSEDKIQSILASVPITERSREDMAMKIGDHQFIVRLLNTWYGATKGDLKQYMKQIYLRDNKMLVASVIESVSEKLGEALVPVYRALEELGTGINNLDKKITLIDKKVTNQDTRIKKLERKVKTIEKDINQLKQDFKTLRA